MAGGVNQLQCGNIPEVRGRTGSANTATLPHWGQCRPHLSGLRASTENIGQASQVRQPYSDHVSAPNAPPIGETFWLGRDSASRPSRFQPIVQQARDNGPVVFGGLVQASGCSRFPPAPVPARCGDADVLHHLQKPVARRAVVSRPHREISLSANASRRGLQ